LFQLSGHSDFLVVPAFRSFQLSPAIPVTAKEFLKVQPSQQFPLISCFYINHLLIFAVTSGNGNKIITHKWHVQKTKNPRSLLSCPGPLPIIRHLPEPSPFSLHSNFNKLKVLTWIKTGLLAFDWGHLLTFELRRSLAIYETWQQEPYSRFFIII
jgi:hypothetical protein